MAEKKSKTPEGQSSETQIPRERSHFKSLLLSNPNYFGSFPGFGGSVVFPQSSNRSFEEISCLGLNPQQRRLEAVVQIKQHSGYGSDACGEGTREYVRFFVQHGSAWVDLGVASFDVFSLPATPLPLSYSVSVNFDEARKFCTTENILNVRAILSWNLEPPAGNASFVPPWGNVIDARVQVAPWRWWEVAVSTLLSEGLIKLDKEIADQLDLSQKLSAKAQPALSFSTLKSMYANSDVPVHRFGFTEAQKLLARPILSAVPAALAPATDAPQNSPFPAVKLAAGPELGVIIAALENQSGNTDYEVMSCAGYNPQTRELEAVIQIKRGAGYLGGLCTAGSTEYVSFFAFFDGTWQALGTATVNVHDLAAASTTRPISFAVRRISNLAEVPCKDLTGIPLRAILSWQTQPTGPDFHPVWGNVINTHVQPAVAAAPGEDIRLMRIGGVTVTGISDLNFLANPTGVAGDCSGNDSPFGGQQIIEGDFTPKIDVFNHLTGVVLPGAKPIIYQVWITPINPAGMPFQLTNAFGIQLFPPDALVPPPAFTQQVKPAPGPVSGGGSGDQYYQYMESSLQAVNPRTLAVFEAGGLEEGDYQVEIRSWSWNGATYVPVATQAKTIHVYNGYPHTEFVFDGTSLVPTTVLRPQISLTLTSVGDCDDVTVGTTITGSYSVVDNFFGSVSIGLVPITIGGSPVPLSPVILVPAPGESAAYDGTNTNGSHGTFTLDTSGMEACGYTIELTASDRALVNSHCYNHWNRVGVGFCLRDPE